MTTDVRLAFESLTKKLDDSERVSFGTLRKTYGAPVGSVKRALEGEDTSKGIDLQQFEVLVNAGVVKLDPVAGAVPESGVSGPDEVIDGELLDLTSQLAVFRAPDLATKPQVEPQEIQTLSRRNYSLNGKLAELQQLQSEINALQVDNDNLDLNLADGEKALEQLAIVEAQMQAKKAKLEQEKKLKRIQQTALEQQLAVFGLKSEDSGES